MNILAPSILSADFRHLGKDIDDIERAGAKYVHIDVMDGLFVPSISFGMPVIASIRKSTNLVFDVHLMIQEPIRYIKDFKEAGADILTVHMEACTDVTQTLKEIRKQGMKAGLSIKPGTSVEALEPYLELCDMILLMSVEPGFGGQTFIDGSLERAAAIKQMIDYSGYSIDLEIDGGVKLDNVREVLKAGVNVIVVGSAVFKDPYYNAVRFVEIVDEG